MSHALPRFMDWQAGFMSLLPAVHAHARISFRKLPGQRREEAIQETIAAACVHYQRAAARGDLAVVRPGPLADFAVRHVRTGRHVGGRQAAARDVHSPVCQRRHGIRLQSHGDEGGWRAVTTAHRHVSVPETAAFRNDYERWLQTLGRRDRQIIAALVSG